ncbi:unnamed protein product [Echinostoma caproni]|uniref:EGF-like domain-containing protein n=1 Tax=Echinostoma caproni TaxID=27848 RepID=A0A183A3N7_9TREM|nr:unnamed protein product [Echinostoma caproni]
MGNFSTYKIVLTFYALIILQKFTCHCKPQYTGTLCNEPVDACKQRIQHPYLMNGGLLAAGDRACNVNEEGNLCYSFISNEGDVYYKCKCDGRKWGPDPKLPYDNCLKRRSQCDSIVCIHGKCVANEHGAQVSKSYLLIR